MTFRARCACGAVAEGPRPSKARAVPCPGCGRRLFVFAAPPGEPRPPRRWRWRGPLIAAALSVALLAIVLAVIIPLLARGPGTAVPALEAIEARLGAGERLLGQGKFHLARAELDEAVRLRAAAPGLLDAERGRHLNQVQRQADLLARLSPLALEEVVRHASLERDDDERAARWAAFRGTTILFDDALRRGPDGKPEFAGLRVRSGGEDARLSLDGVEALRDLPLEAEPRVIFGARLASCKREEGGGWVIRFEPGSGVLMTDAAALEAACAVPLDEGVKEVLTRQRRWVKEHGRAAPARP